MIIDICGLTCRSKKQYVWKFSIDGSDSSVELHVSKDKYSLKVNQITKIDKQKKTKHIQYSFEIDGVRFTVQSIGDGFDIIYKGDQFQVLLESKKRRNTAKNPFEVKTYGDSLNNIVAPTSRDQGTTYANKLQAMVDRNDDEEIKQDSSSKATSDSEYNEAIRKLEEEKEQMIKTLRDLS